MWAVTICNNIKEGTGERMEERKDEICEGCEVHEDLLKIVNETLPEETELPSPSPPLTKEFIS